MLFFKKNDFLGARPYCGLDTETVACYEHLPLSQSRLVMVAGHQKKKKST